MFPKALIISDPCEAATARPGTLKELELRGYRPSGRETLSFGLRGKENFFCVVGRGEITISKSWSGRKNLNCQSSNVHEVLGKDFSAMTDEVTIKRPGEFQKKENILRIGRICL